MTLETVSLYQPHWSMDGFSRFSWDFMVFDDFIKISGSEVLQFSVLTCVWIATHNVSCEHDDF